MALKISNKNRNKIIEEPTPFSDPQEELFKTISEMPALNKTMTNQGCAVVIACVIIGLAVLLFSI